MALHHRLARSDMLTSQHNRASAPSAPHRLAPVTPPFCALRVMKRRSAAFPAAAGGLTHVRSIFRLAFDAVPHTPAAGPAQREGGTECRYPATSTVAPRRR